MLLGHCDGLCARKEGEAGDQVGEADKGQATWGPAGHHRVFEFSS